MKNNMSNNQTAMQKSNVIYEFTCPLPHRFVETYIGMTQNCLSRRLTLHLGQGSILEHFRHAHQLPLTRQILEKNTKIIEFENTRRDLLIKEALLILKKKPRINKQNDNFDNVLKLNCMRRIMDKKPPALISNKNLETSILKNIDNISKLPN